MPDGRGGARAPRRFSFSTTDPERANAFIAGACVQNSLGRHDDAVGFRFRAEEIVYGSLRLTRIRQRAGYRSLSGPIEHVLIVQPLCDKAALGSPHDPVRIPRGVPMLAPQKVPLLSIWSGLCCNSVRFAMAQAVQVATERVGIRPEDFAFCGGLPASYQKGRLWLNTVAYVARDVLGVPEIAANPLIVGEAIRMVAVTALATFANTAMTLDPIIDVTAEPCNGRGPATPAVVRRALDFIDAHAREDLTLTAIAEAARIGPRGLAYAFHRHLDTTPMAYVRKVRLEGAHRDLEAADPTRGDTVAAIARAWGFANVGRFAGAYRRAYGRPPSHTLRG
jgi:AraC-like DNA-binding protein